MLESYTHGARVRLAEGADRAAPGGAVTLALCGAWEHALPCPIAPHRTTTSYIGDVLEVDVAFETVPEQEAEVRALIDAALASGHCVGPDGATSTWEALDRAP